MTDFPDRDRYDTLDAQTLTNLLVDANQKAEVHQRALNALTHIQPDERRNRLIMVLRKMMHEPECYDDEVKLSLVEVLGTDPHPAATTAMLQVLPDILSAAMSEGNSLPADFREYFYQALVTRTREGDLDVWRQIIPQLDPQTLVAILLDPVAGSLIDAIEPLELISRLDEPERSRALISTVVGLAYVPGRHALMQHACQILLSAAGQEHLVHALGVLEERWNKARRNGKEQAVTELESALTILDNRPRSSLERLRGRRPWAT